MQEQNRKSTDLMTRLALCGAVAVGLIYAAETLCEGKNWPLWDKYGPWILENRVQATALLAAVLYGVSLALWPEEKILPGETVEGFQPCE